MKKVILFIAVISAFSFASCKKDHVCTCTYTYTSGGFTTTSTDVTTYTDSKKNQALSHCLNETGSGTGYTFSSTCTLN